MKQRDLFGAAAAPLHEIAGLSGNCCRKAKRSNYRIERAVPPGLVIYCDGACEPNPGAGGWGFVVYRDGVEIHSDCGGSNPTTNNIMELTGALRALRWIATMDGKPLTMDGSFPVSVRLFCDSQYVVSGANSWRHGWKRKGWQRGGPKAKPENRTIANLELWKELDAALTAVPIQLEWVKGHAGIIGNERADELSLMGRESVLAPVRSLIDEQLDYSARGGW
ncbi:ribonuclease H family protein [Aquamicrobium soli]|uniref:ribonuclease H n=1 Tax=Aquamicrobium soli TaxID=1811518 RepID=A0ABV7KE64_9HYPH